MRQRDWVVFPLAVAGLLLCGWLFAAPVQAQSTDGKPEALNTTRERKRERDDVKRRQEWFYRQRRYPLPVIPAGARLNALQQRDASRREQERRGLVAANTILMAASGSSGWISIGPSPTAASGFDFLDDVVIASNLTNFSGRINAIAVDPVSPNIIYLGGADGGLWRSTDTGNTWTALTDFQPSLGMGAIAIDPGSCSAGYCQTVYVGTGEANNNGDAYYGAGVLKLTMTGSATSPTITFTQLGANPGSVTLKSPYTPAPNTPVPNSFVGPFDVAVGGSYFNDLIVNPTNSQLLLASVRIFEEADKGESSGIFCSDNAGVSWTQVVQGAAGTGLVMAPNGTTAWAALGTFFGSSSNGIYETSNANASCTSQTWSMIAGPSKFSLPAGTALGRISLALAPGSTAPFTLYAAVANGGNTSSGEADESSDLIDVYNSTTSGNTWTRTHAPNICTPQCWYDMTIKVHPNNPNVVFLGGSATSTTVSSKNCDGFPCNNYLLRSLNGGGTWDDGTLTTEIAFDGTNEIHVDQHAIAFSPPACNTSGCVMLVGNDGGIWSTPINGTGTTGTGTVTWTDLNSTLTLSQFYPGISIHPSSQLVAIGGLQDNGSQKYDAGTNPGSTIWTQINGADGGATYFDPDAPNVTYTTTEFLSDDVFFIEKSVTNGDIDSTGAVTFSPATNGINGNGAGTDYAEFIPSLAGDPTPGNNRVLYYPTCQIYQSRDGADNWSAMTSSSLCAAGKADYVAIGAAADGNTVYAVDSIGHVHATTNAVAGSSATWMDISSAPYSPLPAATSTTDPVDGRESVSVAVAPNNPQFALVGYSGFCGFNNISNDILDNVGHIFETTNGGASWTDISGGCNATPGQSLPNTPVNGIVIDPADPTNGTIYVATDVGVFGTSNNGTTWVELDETPPTLPDGAVLSLTLRNASRTLIAGLHGRGVWEYQLPLTAAQSMYSLANIIPVFAVQGSGSAVNLTVNGQGFASGDTVNYNGVPLATTFVSATQLTATIPSGMLATAGQASITVVDPTNGTSNAVPFSVEVVYNGSGPAPANDSATTAIVVPSGALSFTDIQNTANAPTLAAGKSNPAPPSSCLAAGEALGKPAPVSSGVANAIWYAYTPPMNATIEADTVGSVPPNTQAAIKAGIFGGGADTILQVFTGSPGSFTSVACNDDINTGDGFLTSEVTFSSTQNTTYYFMISQYEAVGGTTVFNLNVTPTPTLSSITPNSGMAGTSFPVTLVGSGFTPPLELIFNGTGGTFSNVQVVSSTMITATLTLSPSATATDSVQEVPVESGIASNALPFSVTGSVPALPTITAINPSAAVLGTTNLMVTITGTGFVSGPTFAVNLTGGTGITVTNATVTSSTTITALFTIAANATTPVQQVSVTTAGGTSSNLPFGVGTNFSLVANPTSASVMPGANASTMLTITPTTANAQFPANLVLSASGIPSLTSCSFASGAAGFSGGSTGTLPAADGTAASTTVTFMCTTTATTTSWLGPQSHRPDGPWRPRLFVIFGWGALLLALGAGVLAARGGRSAPLRWAWTAVLILLFMFSGLMAACGGGGSSSPPPITTPGTPAGNYMITVTGTTANATQTAVFSLTVQ